MGWRIDNLDSELLISDSVTKGCCISLKKKV
jgi:hypothetical protein